MGHFREMLFTTPALTVRTRCERPEAGARVAYIPTLTDGAQYGTTLTIQGARLTQAEGCDFTTHLSEFSPKESKLPERERGQLPERTMARTKPSTGPRRPGALPRAVLARMAARMVQDQEQLVLETAPSETEEESIFPEDEVRECVIDPAIPRIDCQPCHPSRSSPALGWQSSPLSSQDASDREQPKPEQIIKLSASG